MRGIPDTAKGAQRRQGFRIRAQPKPGLIVTGGGEQRAEDRLLRGADRASMQHVQTRPDRAITGAQPTRQSRYTVPYMN